MLRLKEQGHDLFWIIVTNVSEDLGWDSDFIARRQSQIAAVADFYGFACVHDLHYPPASLENCEKARLIGDMSECFSKIEPEMVLLPSPDDAHSDHRIVFEAAMSCLKIFRCKSLRCILTMEILSETDFSKTGAPFEPNLFVDIEDYIAGKIAVLKIYDTELGEPPFPRSIQAVKALALLRGCMAGCQFAEAFHVIKMIDKSS